MRISDWSSDVCSSDLRTQARTPAPPPKRRRSACEERRAPKPCPRLRAGAMLHRQTGSVRAPLTPIWDAVQESRNPFATSEIGRARARDRLSQNVMIPVVALPLKTKNKDTLKTP